MDRLMKRTSKFIELSTNAKPYKSVDLTKKFTKSPILSQQDLRS